MLWYIIEILSSLWNTEQKGKVNEEEIEPIDEGWIALLSETEKRTSQERRNTIASELRLIAQNNRSFKIYPRILKTVRKISLEYDPTTLQELSSFPLSSDIKYRMFKDILIDLSPKWLEQIGEFAPEILNNWYPEKYKQNILGEMISITSHTSPDQLTVVGLSQTIKAIHLSLIQSLNSYRMDPLSNEESSVLLDLMMSSVISKVLNLWIETVSKCKRGLRKAGKAVAKIKEQERNKLKSLEKIKESGQIDARYSTGENDSLRQKYLQGEQEILIDKNSFSEIKRHVGEKLFI